MNSSAASKRGGKRRNSTSAGERSAARLIDERIKSLRGAAPGRWRGEMLARVRSLIRQAVPTVVEEWKWSVPVWSCADGGGIICTGEAYKTAVKLTFPRGASLPDPSGLFNSSLTGGTRRAIDLHEGDKIDAAAFKALVRAGAAPREQRAPAKAGSGKPAAKARKAVSASSRSRVVTKPRLLSGGNPQIAKGDGDAPVQAYIEAVPGWKRGIAVRLDALIERAVPGVRKAVKWNSPFYGVAGQGWFVSFHCFTKYVKVGFFNGALLKPPPPGESKQKGVRYLDIHEGDWGASFDEAQLADWVQQAARLPGWSGA